MTRTGDVVNGVYLKDEIGAGSSGVVFLGIREKDKEVLAVKMIRINKATKTEDKKMIQNEMDIGLSVGKSCLYLVDYEEVIMKEEECFIFYEYFPKGDLGKLIDERVKKKKPFTEEEICGFLYGVGSGLKTLHDNGILHRDLKPGNIFCCGNDMHKIGDYGFARYADAQASRSMTIGGTIGYIAPELLEGKKNYSFEVDIFALGCILWKMMYLCHPFSNADGSINQRLLFLGTPTDGGGKTLCNTTLQDFARSMIALNPTKRPTAEMIVSLPFLVRVRVEHLEKQMALLRQENVKVKEDNATLKSVIQSKGGGGGKKVKTWPAGDAQGRVRYEGEMRGEMREGYGVQTYSNGDRFEGKWVNDQREGKGKILYGKENPKGRVSYDGDWKGDVPEGDGVMVWKDEEVHVGKFAADLASGKGTRNYRDGNVHIGGYEAGNPSGEAIHRYADGTVYVGGWKTFRDENGPDGKGTMVFSNGDVYVGNWNDGAFHGQGVMTYSNGRRYEGRWKNGCEDP